MHKNLASKIKDARLRKLPVMVALIAALVVPTAISTYAQENSEEPVDIPVANVDENGELQNEAPAIVETPEPTPENTEEPPVAPEEQEVVEPPATEVDNPTENEDEVAPEDTPQAALDRYIAFAQAEHPGVEIASVKFVWKQGVKSAKITFVDGWKVFVGVSDGSTLKVTDARDHVKKCQKRMLSNRSWNRWYKSSKSYYQWWLDRQQQDDQSEEEPAGTGSETGQAQVQGAATKKSSNGSRKSDKSNKSQRGSTRNNQGWSRH